MTKFEEFKNKDGMEIRMKKNGDWHNPSLVVVFQHTFIIFEMYMKVTPVRPNLQVKNPSKMILRRTEISNFVECHNWMHNALCDELEIPKSPLNNLCHRT